MKELLRIKHLQRRNFLSEKEVEKKSRAITEKLFALPEFKEAKTILFYANIGNEAPTLEAMEKALRLGKKVAVPVTSFKDKKICISEIREIGELEKKENGLVEPRGKGGKNIPLAEIDLIIVPGVSFDTEGYRIGYGGGFYDRLLLKAPRRISVVGLCFEENLEERIPRQSHDARMDKIVTDKRIIEV